MKVETGRKRGFILTENTIDLGIFNELENRFSKAKGRTCLYSVIAATKVQLKMTRTALLSPRSAIF